MGEFCGGRHFLTRRDFLALAGSAAAVPLVSGCGRRDPAATTKAEPVLKIGYLPITDAAPLLVGHAQKFFEQEGLKLEAPVLVRGWSELSEAFLSGAFNVVHLLIPMPVYMRFAQRHRVKVVAWNHINGSALTVGLKSGIKSMEQLGGKQIAVPYWYSMHNVILQLCMRQYGLEAVIQDRKLPLKKNQTNLFVMRPPDMPTAIASGAIDGYIVAEPFNAAGEVLAKGSVVRFTGDVFKNHPCCVVVMREEDIEQHPEWAQKVVNGLVKSQHWIGGNREAAATLLSKEGKGYLPLPGGVITRAMTKYDIQTYGPAPGTAAIRHPDWGVQRIGFQPYPFESATREIVKLLAQTRVEGSSEFLKTLNPETVVNDLFNYDLVRKAAEKVGGLKVFEGIDPANPFIRAEAIEV
jgi:NitT/TauT family transport system substrate-binding protein